MKAYSIISLIIAEHSLPRPPPSLYTPGGTSPDTRSNSSYPPTTSDPSLAITPYTSHTLVTAALADEIWSCPFSPSVLLVSCRPACHNLYKHIAFGYIGSHPAHCCLYSTHMNILPCEGLRESRKNTLSTEPRKSACARMLYCLQRFCFSSTPARVLDSRGSNRGEVDLLHTLALRMSSMKISCCLYNCEIGAGGPPYCLLGPGTWRLVLASTPCSG